MAMCMSLADHLPNVLFDTKDLRLEEEFKSQRTNLLKLDLLQV
jgi:hypothetical protein